MKMKIADYLIKRLHEVHVDHIFGVPGDYNLGFLDYVEDSKEVDWIGCCNELNAGYAADGYARIRGMGAVATTYGVGELSAINATAGSFAESVPVIHIAGVPSSMVKDNRLFVHHSTGRGEFDTFDRIFREVTGFQTTLNEYDAADEIDRLIESVYKFKLPGYLEFPVDIVSKEIDVDMKPLDLCVRSNPDTLKQLVDAIAEEVKNSKAQHIIADYKVLRAAATKEMEEFVNYAKIPVSTLSMGKTAVSEENPYFAGVFTGAISSEQVKKVANSSDLVLLFGVKFTDTTTAGFQFINNDKKWIQIGLTQTRIGEKVYTGVYITDVIKALTASNIKFTNSVKLEHKKEKFVPKDAPLTQDRYYELIGAFLKKGDVVVAETGTSYFGCSTVPFPQGATFVGQPLWGSIGYACPAVLGTNMADKNRRNILLIGDGSFQLTAQEVSTMIRQKLKTILFVINNDGYTIERIIHGKHREYNHTQMWNYAELPKVFATKGDVQPTTFKVSTEKELAKVMETIDKGCDGLVLVEVTMGMLDAPQVLRDEGILFSKQNNY